MNKLFCDHCKQELMGTNYIASIQTRARVGETETKSLTINDLSLTLDLCSTCASELKNMLYDFFHKRPTDSVDRVIWLKEESLS